MSGRPGRRPILSRLGLLLGLTLLAAACDEGSLSPVACTEQFVFGLQMEVREADGGAPAAQGAVATVTDGDYVEVVAGPISGGPDALFLVAAGERAGTYDIEVAREGFETWDTTGVVVDEDICHVITEQVPVFLTRLP
jgi:hypothetical protein